MTLTTTSELSGVGVLAEPPVTAAPADRPPDRPAGAAARADDRPTFNGPPKAPPIEAQLVQLGVLSVGQLAEAHRQRLETGRPVLEIAIEKGWLTEAQIIELGGTPPAAAATAAPATAPAQAPVREAQPAPEPPPPAAEKEVPETDVATFTLFLQLTDGELVEAGRAQGEQRAEALAREVVAEITRSGAGKWPYFSRRFIRPDTIVSVALVEGELTQS
jgi:hypothetical protein